ncbi:P12 family lipoprotein [Borreliella burgdorferi]|uniref:P12 family lipoprotein n=1 Tax=Borreliella burgdorferi TaxID=139 RepID=UPI00019940E6|nr:P12 family lipoprotein [Borreliella burgdorferi]ACO38081.1 conserved hypothetical protein [Borreliella burgdorferi Bol26]
MCSLKHEYSLIKSDFYKISLIKNYRNNRDKIRKLVQLQNNLKMGDELDEIMGYIDIAEQEIRSAAFFFDEDKESLKEGIIKRLKKSEKRAASRLSKQALNKAEDALRSLETYSSKKG